MDWPRTALELEAAQRALAELWERVPRWRAPEERPYTVGGVFVASARDGEDPCARGEAAWVAAVVFEQGLVIDSGTKQGTFDAAYHPGLLALREGRLLTEVVASLRRLPDVLLVNATGRDHPRRTGLALHLGAVLGLPTIGVTDRPLIAEGPQPGASRGSAAELRLDREVVGYRVRTVTGARSIVVHAGWRVDPLSACSVVLEVAGAARTPAPLREARRLARTLRAPSQLA